MEVLLGDIVKYCNKYLNVDSFSDYCPNGLQVESNKHVSKIALGVSACMELFEKAKEINADLIIVHHGLIWGNQQTITGVYGKRIKFLLENKISLMAYHLPLDAHLEIGNNATIADLLELKNSKSAFKYNGKDIGIQGEIKPIKFEDFLKAIREQFGKSFASYDSGALVEKIGICSGGASREVEQAKEYGLDTYITGEIGESTLAFLKEAKMNYIALGHYNSEKTGVKALGEHILENFGIKSEFIEIDNPY
jgi:dinuclear metal center YbgI/SA1388 family protein